jgi:hypothetical protein
MDGGIYTIKNTISRRVQLKNDQIFESLKAAASSWLLGKLKQGNEIGKYINSQPAA